MVLGDATYRPHVRTPWHTHELTSLEVVLGGAYVKRTKRSDYDCVPGTVTVEPPGDEHAGVYGPMGWHAVIIEIPSSRLNSLESVGAALNRPMCGRIVSAPLLGRRVAVEMQRTDTASALVLEGLALELIALALREERAVSGSRVPPAWLRRATELLRDEFRSAIQLDALAEVGGVHPTHLARAFRRYHDCTVGEYVRRLRVEWAAAQLTTTATAVATIAQDAGFYDQSHFSRAFKAHFGSTPAGYRALIATRPH